MGPSLGSYEFPLTYAYKVDKIEDLKDCSGFKIKCSLFDEKIGLTSNILTKLNPKKIIYNGPATIVFWMDGSKTVVKCAEMDHYNRYNAFCAALAKKLFGSNSKVNRIVKNGEESK